MIKLPKGYKAVKDRAVGISYIDSKGNIFFQHFVDSDLARKALRVAIKLHKCQLLTQECQVLLRKKEFRDLQFRGLLYKITAKEDDVQKA